MTYQVPLSSYGLGFMCVSRLAFDFCAMKTDRPTDRPAGRERERERERECVCEEEKRGGGGRQS